MMPVYFVQAGVDGPIKIGTAINPAARLAILQSGHYQTLRILRTVAGGAEVERSFHRQFRALRVRGEWFRFDPLMLTTTGPTTMNEAPWDFIERFAREHGVADEAVRKWRVRGVPHRWRLPIASAGGPFFDSSIFDEPPGPRAGATQAAAE